MLNFSNNNVKLVEKFKFFISISIAIVLIGTVIMLTLGMNIGIDFSGGAIIDIELSSFASNSDAKEIIEEDINKFFSENGLKSVGAMQVSTSSSGDLTYEFRLAYYHNGDLKTTEQEAQFIDFIIGDSTNSADKGLCAVLQARLENLFQNNSTLVQIGATIEDDAVIAYTVGATATTSLLNSAAIALAVAIVAMIIYIFIRFNLSSAFAAIFAVIHDIIIMTMLTVVFQIPINSIFIAGIITVAGYSINTTIVIFDRIRENLRLDVEKAKSDKEIANMSVMQTLSRNILTCLTTLTTLVMLAIFSVSVIREFVFPIIFGLLAGSFSSMLIAPALWVMLRKIASKFKRKKSKNSYRKTPKVNN